VKNQTRPENEKVTNGASDASKGFVGEEHPTQPDQLCATRCQRWSQVFELPEGLATGDLVRTVRAEEGFWIVEGLTHPGQFWRLPGFLLEVISRS
jgi:hypothetical protein